MSNANASTRKWAPKGKGGCRTCRSRHVRCDKKRPRCSPCHKSSRHCEYSPNSDPDPLKIVLWQQPNELALHRLSDGPSHTSDELRAFHFFRTSVAMNLGGFFCSQFWAEDILQVAQQEDSVRHAVIALSSLSETLLQTTGKSPKSETLAFRQHNKAISNLSSQLKDNNDSKTEVILITCALLICFEMFQNNYQSALSQMANGIYLFYSWRTKQNRETSCKEFGGLLRELERIFGRLMLQTIMFINTNPSEWKFVTPEFTPPLPPIPSTFHSVHEARESLDKCMCSLYHKMLTIQFQDLASPDLEAELPKPPPRGGAYLDPLSEWSQAFGRFTTEHGPTFDIKEQKAALLIEIYHTSACILSLAGAFSDEMIFDSYEHYFSRIISLASCLLDRNILQATPDQPRKLPAFDMGVLPPLYYTASRCRDPSIRRQALHLLRLAPKQEGIWERDILVAMAERTLMLEEMACESVLRSSDIPAMARLSMINAMIDPLNRVVTLYLCRQVRGEGTPDVMHEIIEY